MSESKHTPGPWRVWQPDCLIEGPNGEEVNNGPIGSLVVDGNNQTRFIADFDAESEESSANAYLVAAAPDLLAASKGALDQMSLSANADFTPTAAHRALLDAIAKAEGRMP